MWGGPLGGSGCLMCIGCMGGAPLRLKKLLANSSGGWGRAEMYVTVINFTGLIT